MQNVDDDAGIRQAHQEGMSRRGLAKLDHHPWQKIREVLESPEPRAERRSEASAVPKLGPFPTRIAEIRKTDEERPPKPRHRAARLHRRLKAQ